MATLQKLQEMTWYHFNVTDVDDLESPVFHFEPGWGHPEGHDTKVASKLRQKGTQGRLKLVQTKELSV